MAAMTSVAIEELGIVKILLVKNVAKPHTE